MSTSFDHFLTVTASTKRAVVASGKRGAPATRLASLRCMPLGPVSAEIAQRMELNTPHELLQTFVDNVDVAEGDVLVVGSKEYPVQSAADWAWKGTVYRHLVLEDLKR